MTQKMRELKAQMHSMFEKQKARDARMESLLEKLTTDTTDMSVSQ